MINVNSKSTNNDRSLHTFAKTRPTVATILIAAVPELLDFDNNLNGGIILYTAPGKLRVIVIIIQNNNYINVPNSS